MLGQGSEHDSHQKLDVLTLIPQIAIKNAVVDGFG